MNIFVLTDNKIWLDAATNAFKESNVNFEIFCSPSSMELFSNELNNNAIRTLDIKKNYQYLIDNFDLGFSCHCKQIFPEELVNNVRCINIHPGLNPFNRGWYPQVFSILNKKPAGATIHVMDRDVDHGEIIAQQQVPIYDWDTSKTVYDRVISTELVLFKENLDKLISETYTSYPMVSEGNYNSIKDYKDLLEIDMDKRLTMQEAIDYLRALTHEPYDNAYFINDDGEKVFVSINLKKA